MKVYLVRTYRDNPWPEELEALRVENNRAYLTDGRVFLLSDYNAGELIFFHQRTAMEFIRHFLTEIITVAEDRVTTLKNELEKITRSLERCHESLSG